MILTSTDYHDLTSYDRNKMTGHYLDWSNQPNTFKFYEGLKNIKLIDQKGWSNAKFCDLFMENEHVPRKLDFEDVSRILKLGHCLIRKEKLGTGDFYFRSVASAGALYPFEMYMATKGVEDLEDGIYHHSVADQSITQLRKGDFSGVIAPLTNFVGGHNFHVMFLLTAIFFRSSWKYRDRAFRYHLLDTGHLCENLALALKAESFEFGICYDFDDLSINQLLGVDPARESCLALVTVSSEANEVEIPDSLIEKTPVDLGRFSKCAPEEIRYPAINEIYTITSRKSHRPPDEHPAKPCSAPQLESKPLRLPVVENQPEVLKYSEAVFTRRSRRNFIRKPIPESTFSWILGLFRGNCASEASWSKFLSFGVLISDVGSISQGFYLLDPFNGDLSLVKSGFLTETMAHICLDQAWLANCSSHFVFIADLDCLESQYGPRAYRYGMLEAGRLGQRLYLAAESLKLGCCGIGAFYDQEARTFLNLRSGARLLYLVALGPLKKSFA
jgi:SagB-type dehydrogenase family enzyme